MKTYKQFINEGVTDYLQGKSEDDVYKELNKLSDNDKIKYIIMYQLDYNLLPRNNEGICVYKGDLDCRSHQLNYLPNNLTIMGNLFCSRNNLTSLPDNLTVRNDLFCRLNQLTYLPDSLTVGVSLYFDNNKLTILPDNLIVNGDLFCYKNQLTTLPNNLTVKGDLDCRNNKVKLKLPKDAKIGGYFYN